MNNKLPAISDNNKKLQLVQSIEKEQDTLSLRKKLAKEYGLTSIGEFIEWWAMVYKDKRYRIMNEQWEYMRDPTIKNLQHKKIDTSWPWCIGFSYEEGDINGNGDFVKTEEDNTDIIQSKHWIFSAKDGIIIVVDDWDFCNARLYSSDGNRMPISEWWSLDTYAITDKKGAYSIYDDFSFLRNVCVSDINSSIFDRRKNIIKGLIPVHLDHNYCISHNSFDKDKAKKIHNLWFSCSYNLMNKEWQLLKTELWEYYANNKRWFDGSSWLIPCVHGWLSKSTKWHNERLDDEEIRPVFYAIHTNGKVFRDEFNNIVLSDDSRWMNNFDKEWYAPLVIDKKIRRHSDHPYTEYSAYICFINKEWVYRRDNNTKYILIIPFYKTIYDNWWVSDPDIKWYRLFPELGIIEIRQLSITEPWFTWKNIEIYKYFDYYGREIKRSDYFDDSWQEKRLEKIDRWDTKERIYKVLSEDLTIYGHGTKIDHESPRWWLNSYWWNAKIVNKKMNYKNVQFPDGKDIFNYDFNYDFKQFWKSYIFHENHVDPRWWRTYECVKINWLIARYQKDEQGKELQWVYQIIKSVDDKYLFIQREEWSNFQILNSQFQYIKDSKWKILEFPHRPPFYVDGMFLYYDTIDWVPKKRYKSKEMYVREAYFEDGTRVGDTSDKKISIENQEDIIDKSQNNILKLL